MKNQHDKRGLVLVIAGIAVALAFIIIVSLMSGVNPLTFNYPIYR